MTTIVYPGLDQIAGEVLLRHTCHCDDAVEKSAPHEHDEHVFQIDGEDFPWFLSARGPIVKRLRDDLYTVDIEIFLLAKEDGAFHYLDFGYAPIYGTPFLPVINGEVFPWLLDPNGWELRAGHKRLPEIRLTFYARNVTGNYPIEDSRPDDPDDLEAVYCAGGDLIAAGKDRCIECGELIDEMFEHIKTEHPQAIRIGPEGQEGYPVS